MHSKSDIIEIMISDAVIKKIFDSLKKRYKNLASMRGSDFVLDYVQLFYYKRHKVNLKRSGSYVDSPNWIKTKQKKIPSIKKINIFKTLWQSRQIIKK